MIDVLEMFRIRCMLAVNAWSSNSSTALAFISTIASFLLPQFIHAWSASGRLCWLYCSYYYSTRGRLLIGFPMWLPVCVPACLRHANTGLRVSCRMDFRFASSHTPAGFTMEKRIEGEVNIWSHFYTRHHGLLSRKDLNNGFMKIYIYYVWPLLE